MIQVLFVDDDTEVLEDFRRLLGIAGVRWNIDLASSGDDAIKMLTNGVYDVIVSDLMMPGMDGAELLTIVREECPTVMRILMSGHSDVSFTARLVPQAHQFLMKPLDLETVIATVERAYEVGQRLADPELKALLGQITELPRPPQSVIRLNQLLDDGDADISEVVEVVEHDMALTAKLFQLVNSAYYGLGRTIQDVREAVSYLGMNAVRNLAVSIEVFRTVSSTSHSHADVIAELNESGNDAAQIARQLVLGREQANEAFIAGLLHDVGLLALVSFMPDRYTALCDAARRSHLPLADLELEIVGASHADLGAYLLDMWGLPFPIVEAVARHHDAMHLPVRRMDPAHAVCIANSVVMANRGDKILPGVLHAPLDSAYLKELGVLERVAGLMAVGAG